MNNEYIELNKFSSIEDIVTEIERRDNAEKGADDDDILPEDIGRFTEPYSNPRWWFGGGEFPQCFSCKYFYGMVKGKRRCKAYPKGIPAELLTNDVAHKTPYEGDGGIVFELAEEETEEYQKRELERYRKLKSEE